MLLLLILLLLLSAGAADHLSCAAHFPIRESVTILKKLVAKHATPVVRKDANGTEWLNNIFLKNGALEVDGVHYFLNDNRLPPEMTFYFTDSLLLDSVPIFVVDPNQTKTWRPDFPDRTYALTKISHRCDVGQRACGLKCCYEENHTIQKEFIELSKARSLTASSTYTFNDITYSLSLLDNSSTPKCSYYLSYYDPLFRKEILGGKQVSAIYFSCPNTSTCCGLNCLPLPSTALLRKPRQASLFSFQIDRQHLNALLTVGAAMSLIAFLLITLINHRRASRELVPTRLIVREMVDSQTSTVSLHDDHQTLLGSGQVVYVAAS